MKFGYFCNTTNWTHKPYHQLLDETKEITEYCDQNKWNSIWFTEHHFNHEGMESCTNPLMMGADAAARTKNIRIGQAANVITFHNPIRLAEDIATLDQLSKGRVEVGVARGIYGREAINLNKEADLKDQAKNFRLFAETLEVLKKAWSEKFFSHQGEFYTYPSPNYVWQHDMSPPSEEFMNMEDSTMKKISVVPQPYQQPHPPIHQVVDGIRSIEWAAENNINIIKSIKEHKGSYNNIAQLLEFIGDSPEERNMIAALAVDVPEKENESIILSDCIKTLEDLSIKKEISQIRNQIRIAEDNNQNLDTSLIRKLEELQKKIS